MNFEIQQECECFCDCGNLATEYDDMGIPICKECELISVQGHQDDQYCLRTFNECSYCGGQLTNDQNSYERVRGTVYAVLKACENCGAVLGRRSPDQFLVYFKINQD